MLTIRVFDNKGKTWDRYTVEIVTDEDSACYGMSENAMSPDGFNQWMGERDDLDTYGDIEVLNLLELPEQVKKAISNRIFDNN